MKNKRMMGFVSFSSGVVIPRVFLSSLVYDFRTAFIYGLLYTNQVKWWVLWGKSKQSFEMERQLLLHVLKRTQADCQKSISIRVTVLSGYFLSKTSTAVASGKSCLPSNAKPQYFFRLGVCFLGSCTLCHCFRYIGELDEYIATVFFECCWI